MTNNPLKNHTTFSHGSEVVRTVDVQLAKTWYRIEITKTFGKDDHSVYGARLWVEEPHGSFKRILVNDIHCFGSGIAAPREDLALNQALEFLAAAQSAPAGADELA
jgi:hypothetical protein